MTDQQHARKIKKLTEALNAACVEASADGLSVAVMVTQRSAINARVFVEIARPL